MSTASRVFDCGYDEERADGVREGAAALRRGDLVVLPTDTVYGVAADAFSPAAVTKLLAAKGRGRQSPPPVLVGGLDLLPALASSVRPEVTALAEAFWPGALTIICWAQPSLTWDLGETGGTVALRVPDHPLTLELLRACGPLAVSSANRSGRPPGETAAAVRTQLGASVAVYLEDGPAPGGVSSTIVDATGDHVRVVRDGGVTLEQLRGVVPGVLGVGEEPATDEPVSEEPVSEEPVTEEPVTEEPVTAAADGEPVTDAADGEPAGPTDGQPDPPDDAATRP